MTTLRTVLLTMLVSLDAGHFHHTVLVGTSIFLFRCEESRVQLQSDILANPSQSIHALNRPRE
jgi:hypothetical protein